MNNYEIKKGNRGFIKPFDKLESAESWAVSYFTDGFTITDLGPIPPITEDEKFNYQIDESRKLAKMFFVDIRKKNGKINPNFVDIYNYLEQGELSDADAAIQASNRPEIDAEFKAKYNALINNILNYNGQ